MRDETQRDLCGSTHFIILQILDMLSLKVDGLNEQATEMFLFFAFRRAGWRPRVHGLLVGSSVIGSMLDKHRGKEVQKQMTLWGDLGKCQGTGPAA